MIKTWSPLVFAFILILAVSPAAAETEVVTWKVDGVTREAMVFTPTGVGKKHPLVFAFHGHGGNMHFASRVMGFQKLWPEAILVYPQGLPTPTPLDPKGKLTGWQHEAGLVGDRDLKFFDAMLRTMKEKYSADEKRVYTSGFSNGAIFSYLLWAERGKAFAAFGICAGFLPVSVRPSLARPAILLVGQEDRIAPFAKQEQAIETIRRLNGASVAGQACGPRCTLYPSASGTPVMTLIHPGGHIYPPWAARAFVDFFKSQN